MSTRAIGAGRLLPSGPGAVAWRALLPPVPPAPGFSPPAGLAMTRAALRALAALADAAAPEEACGLIGGVPRGGRYLASVYPAESRLHSAAGFFIPQAEVGELERALAARGEVLCGCFHSHTRGPARPSATDVRLARGEGFFWLIYATQRRSFGLFRWTGARFQSASLRIV